jgi:hypothetical protein
VKTHLSENNSVYFAGNPSSLDGPYWKDTLNLK